ncbi:SH3 domain-containing protein C23A1.17-like [Prionailurus viverrinus]|uniref:SH3 domain-containing protein C23A1.17-like n=1 Tax=Prionailurus viverrinus TaxID=61388 RepID=UPI001FF3D8D9|nr:SH3 domain-containing protein C23A1.17-like [Prionailurus viverrinus]
MAENSAVCLNNAASWKAALGVSGFGSENDQKSPPRERSEDRAPQEAPSQERPPDKRQAQFHGAAGHQSSRGRKQGPEGTQDDPPGEGEVSRLLRQGEAFGSLLAAPCPGGGKSLPALQPTRDLRRRAALACPKPKVTAPILLANDPRTVSEPTGTSSVKRAWAQLRPHPAPEDTSPPEAQAALGCGVGAGGAVPTSSGTSASTLCPLASGLPRHPARPREAHAGAETLKPPPPATVPPSTPRPIPTPTPNPTSPTFTPPPHLPSPVHRQAHGCQTCGKVTSSARGHASRAPSQCQPRQSPGNPHGTEAFLPWCPPYSLRKGILGQGGGPRALENPHLEKALSTWAL